MLRHRFLICLHQACRFRLYNLCFAARLEVFRRLLPTWSTRGTSEVWMFKDLSWFSVLLGMNFQFSSRPLEPALLEKAQIIATEKRKQIQHLLEKVPTHYDYLKDTLYIF
jgi:hypothetical protein